MSERKYKPTNRSVGGLPASVVLVLLGCFCLAVAGLGGSSQQGMVQAALLRPLAALYLVPGLYFLNLEKGDPARSLVLIFLALALLMVLQIAPLPPSLWHLLPGRDEIRSLEVALALDPGWRPISFVPSRTLNALMSLLVPLAALLLALSLKLSSSSLLHAILAMAVLNAAMTLAQVASGYDPSLYFYSIGSNRADGLFGNENHSGVFSAIAMLVCACLANRAKGRRKANLLAIAYLGAFALFFLSVLMGGSRAAFACSILSLLGVGAMLYSGYLTPAQASKPRDVSDSAFIPRLAVACGFLATIGLIGTFYWLERSPSLDGLMNQSSFEDLRWELLPILRIMVEQHWAFGIGFGAFEDYFHAYEPTRLLIPAFVNQAHNDWMQLVIEGGLVGVALLLCLIIWYVRRLSEVWARNPQAIEKLVFWIAVFSILAVASLVDYPLRTGIFQVSAIWFLVCLAKDSTIRA